MTPQTVTEAGRVDELFNSLGHTRRRRLVMVVAAESPPISVDRVVEELASHESNADFRSSSGDLSDQVAVSVVHCHLPKLQDAGIVDVGSETGTITEGIQFDDAIDHIRAAETTQ